MDSPNAKILKFLKWEVLFRTFGGGQVLSLKISINKIAHCYFALLFEVFHINMVFFEQVLNLPAIVSAAFRSLADVALGFCEQMF